MKTEITKARIQVRARLLDMIVVRFPYCSFSNYCGMSPKHYNTGVYGWNWDMYEVDNFIIIDGYRSFPAGIDFSNPSDFEAKMRNCKLKGKAKENYIARLIHKAIDPIVKK